MRLWRVEHSSGARPGVRLTTGSSSCSRERGSTGPATSGIDSRRNASNATAWPGLRDVLGPESVIVNAAAHRDELTHHLHVVAVPIQDGKLGWCAVRDAALGRIEERARAEAQAAGLPEPKRRKGTRRYAVLQDAFQAQVRAAFGLDRGDRASGRVHEAIDRAKGVEARRDWPAVRPNVSSARVTGSSAGRTSSSAITGRSRERSANSRTSARR